MATKAAELVLLSQGKGCLGKAANDEPIFILRAQDRFAPDVVEEWADIVEDAIKGDGGSSDVGLEKCQEARLLAASMRAWQVTNGRRKVPD